MLLTIHDFTKIFHQGDTEIRAVDGVTLSLGEGEKLSLMGKSGCGKSTLLNLLACLDSPTSGTYFFEDREVSRFSQKEKALFRREEVTVIFQNYNLIEELTAKENILLPYHFRKDNPEPGFFDEVTDRLGIVSRLNHMPAQLSGGEKQRVAIARALIAKTKLILADEPTGNLDSNTGKEVMTLLLESCRLFQKTLFLVTHDIEIAKLMDRILTMQDGKVISEA